MEQAKEKASLCTRWLHSCFYHADYLRGLWIVRCDTGLYAEDAEKSIPVIKSGERYAKPSIRANQRFRRKRAKKKEYGYCGLADGPEAAMINSDDGAGNDIMITIKLEAE